jgi:hypothetical protein
LKKVGEKPTLIFFNKNYFKRITKRELVELWIEFQLLNWETRAGFKSQLSQKILKCKMAELGPKQYFI